ncbi:MAG: glycoside hydrolase family 88 protein [Eubacteriales bacterium]|nr:glycoside hydrolase family 88 protein [Eubacteriales bacterium]
MKRDIQLEKILSESMKDVNINLHESKDENEKNIKSLLLAAASKMYNETKDDFCKMMVVNTLKTVIGNKTFDDVFTLAVGEALFFAYDQTADEQYKAYICSLAADMMDKTRNKDGVFTGGDGSKETDLSDAYEQLVFYMNYETRFGKKEHYSDVVKQFEAVRNAKRCEKCGLYNDNSNLEVALYLASLINAMEAADQPVYEIFAAVRDIYKETFAGLRDNGKYNIKSEEFITQDNMVEQLILIYALLKGCRMKAILSSKYEEDLNAAAARAFEIVKAQGRTIFKGRNDLLAAVMMAYAESTKERSYQVYGRNKGGAIWS